MRRIYVRAALVLSVAALLVVTGLGVVSGQPAPAQPAPGGPQPQAPANYSGGCVTNKIKFRTEYATSTITTTGTWVTLPSSAVDFTIGGTGYSCLKIEFSAVVWHDQYLYVIAELDGYWSALPTYAYHNAEASWHTFAFNWAFNDVWPGAHTLRIKVYQGGLLYVWSRSVFVHYWQ